MRAGRSKLIVDGKTPPEAGDFPYAVADSFAAVAGAGFWDVAGTAGSTLGEDAGC